MSILTNFSVGLIRHLTPNALIAGWQSTPPITRFGIAPHGRGLDLMDVIGDDLQLDRISSVLEDKVKWRAFINFAETVMIAKEEAEKTRQQALADKKGPSVIRFSE